MRDRLSWPALTIPPLTNRYILMMIGYGVLLLGWLTPEDDTVWLVSLLGTGLAYLVLGLVVRGQWGGRTLAPVVWIPGMIFLGALAGLLSASFTFLLMVMKNVQHAHLVLDFHPSVTVGMLARIPAWMAAGALLHLGLVLGVMALDIDLSGAPQDDKTTLGET